MSFLLNLELESFSRRQSTKPIYLWCGDGKKRTSAVFFSKSVCFLRLFFIGNVISTFLVWILCRELSEYWTWSLHLFGTRYKKVFGRKGEDNPSRNTSAPAAVREKQNAHFAQQLFFVHLKRKRLSVYRLWTLFKMTTSYGSSSPSIPSNL